MKISGCIVTKNEESNIKKCIENLKGVTDEIIVVDTGSTDNTIKIAKRLGAYVYEEKWVNDFSKARNAALQHASGDWIIFLDADEYFNDDSLPKVCNVIRQYHSNTKIEAIQCNMINIDMNSGQILGNNLTLRIFRNQSDIFYINRIHEEIRKNSHPLVMVDQRAYLTIIHTGYSSASIKDKIRRNLAILLDNINDEKASFYLAVSYNILNEYDNALIYADKALGDAIVNSSYQLSYQMHLIRINSLLALRHTDSALINKAIHDAKQNFSNHPEIVKAEANYLLLEGKYNQALKTFMHALNCQEKYAKDLECNNFPSVVHKVYFCIANIYYLLNLELDALEYYTKALKTVRYYPDAFKRLLVLFRLMPDPDIISFINSIYDKDKEEDMKFIITQIIDCGRDQIVLYYVNIWKNVFGHKDDALIYAFISQKRYDKALEAALLYLKTDILYAPLTTSIVIMGKLYSIADKIKDDIGSDFYNIILCYAENRVFTGNSEKYMSVLFILMKLIEQHNIANYLSLHIPKSSIEKDIADLFFSNSRFEYAEGYYVNYYEMQFLDELKALTAFRLAVCNYKLRNYKNSLLWFERAALLGYVRSEMGEYFQTIAEQSSEEQVKKNAVDLFTFYTSHIGINKRKLHLGCGRDIKHGWINLDLIKLPGIDVVADLDACASTPLPFDNDTIDEFYASHIIEHICNPFPMMQELYRVAKNGAKAVFRCPYGTSDDAFEDPTHVKQYYLNSFYHFAKKNHQGIGTGYNANWQVDKVTVVVKYDLFCDSHKDEIMNDILQKRNTVSELIVELSAVKYSESVDKVPGRNQDIVIQYC